MMTAETCSGSIPRLPVHHYHRRAVGYYDPQYQIAGRYLAGEIDQNAPNPRTIDPDKAYITFFGKMQIREAPSIKGAKTKLVTTEGDVYKAVAATWGSPTTAEAMKVGDRDQEWVLLEGAKGLLGWACYAETLKVADPKEQLLVQYGTFLPTVDIKVSKELIAKGVADKKSQVAAVNKWLAKNAPKSSGGGSSTPKAPPAGSEDKSSGLSTTTMVMIGLGAAALVYFLIQQGKNK